jgi:hypothetical protein
VKHCIVMVVKKRIEWNREEEMKKGNNRYEG